MLNFSEQEISDWIKKRSRNALPLIQIPKYDLRFEPCRMVTSLSISILRIQMQGVRYLMRCSRDTEFKKRDKIRRTRPEIQATCRARTRFRQAHDPTFKEIVRKKSKKYYWSHRDLILSRNKQSEWYRTYRKPYMREYMNRKRQTDPNYNIRNRLCSRLWHAVVGCGGEKALKTADLVGCSVPELRVHLENKFSEGMTWTLFCAGKIHIDHIKPCAQFNLKDEQQQKECFHFSNLQPLWGIDNLAKGKKTP